VEKWGLPKGHRDGNETYADCAKRELFEECGLKLKITNKMAKIKINNTYYFPIKIKKNLYNHLLKPNDNKEIDCAKWIKINELKGLTMNRETQIFLARKLQEAKKIVYINVK
jgi:ADP-ribose pyrophosphatase YjhB (NUDIX family)